MPNCRFDDWARWLSSVGVLCLLGVPGLFFPGSDPASEERATPPEAPVEAPTSEHSSDEEDGRQGINPHAVMAAVKHDQLVPRRPMTDDERPRIRPLSRRDTGALNPDANTHNTEHWPSCDVLLTWQVRIDQRRLALRELEPHGVTLTRPLDPAVGTAVRSLAPPHA